MREFSNTESSGLGMPLPQGRVRFYRRDSDGRLEFTGEDEIRHTPRGGTVRVFSGAAFDLTGERRRVSLRVDHARSTAEESFEIRLSNRKSEAVEVRVVEHLFRWSSWELTANAPGFQKTDSQTMECKVRLQPGEEKTASYTVRHTW
jgi:hypothetical protein